MALGSRIKLLKLFFYFFAIASLAAPPFTSGSTQGDLSASSPTRISHSDLFYAAESRNYPEDPDTLFLTTRGRGLHMYNISGPAQFDKLSSWNTSKAVEGQDRVGSLMVVSELGVGPDGAFSESAGPALHLFDLSPPLTPQLSPFATLDLSPFTDGILHVKLLSPAGSPSETWAAVTGGFATATEGALILVNLTRAVADRHSVPLSPSDVNIVSTPVNQPEGVLVHHGYVYVGGIESSSLCVINATDPASVNIVSTTGGVGMQVRRREGPPFRGYPPFTPSL